MINRTVLQGRLCADPELRYTQAGVPVCSFRIAWSEKYKETETKLFLACTAWRGIGEMVSKYFKKGQEIAVEGKLSTRAWQDRDGNNRSAVELTVDNASFCGPKRDGMAGEYGGHGIAGHGDGITDPVTPSDDRNGVYGILEDIPEEELPF